MNKTITLCKSGYDPFIDFAKGICIIFVILNHCIGESIHAKSLFCLWGDAAVPIFLVIQTFHAYKKGLDTKFSFGKVWNRMLKTFFAMQMLLILYKFVSGGGTILKDIISQGGFGNGSYYVWIYVQFALLLPLFSNIFKKYHGWQLLVFFIVISQLAEIMLCLSGISAKAYRLLCFRYLFIIYLGYVVVKRGIVFNRPTILLSSISIIAIIFFYYCNQDLTPFFYTHVSYSWRIFHWVSYFYIAYTFIYILYLLHIKVKRRLKAIIEYLGKYSYEIFLFQMFYFAIAQYGTISFLNVFNNNVSRIIYILLSVSVCLAVVPICNYIRMKAVNWQPK